MSIDIGADRYLASGQSDMALHAIEQTNGDHGFVNMFAGHCLFGVVVYRRTTRKHGLK